MKWLIGILLALNISVFLLANSNDQNNQPEIEIREVPANTADISLLDSSSSQLPGNCANLGPIEQQIVLDQVEKILTSEALSYRILSEASRKVASYRVVIPVDSSTDISDLRQRLQNAGVSETYQKTLANGEQVLSLGVFTYKSTANDLATNLSNAGFTASTEREYLIYPQRYWINLNQPVNETVLASLNRYTGSNIVKQSTAKCL